MKVFLPHEKMENGNQLDVFYHLTEERHKCLLFQMYAVMGVGGGGGEGGSKDGEVSLKWFSGKVNGDVSVNMAMKKSGPLLNSSASAAKCVRGQ